MKGLKYSYINRLMVVAVVLFLIPSETLYTEIGGGR